MLRREFMSFYTQGAPSRGTGTALAALFPGRVAAKVTR